MQGKLADMYTTMNSSRAFVYAVAAACDRGRKTRFDSAAAILKASEGADLDGRANDPGARRQRLHDRVSGRPALARREALRDRRRHATRFGRMLIGRELFAATAEAR